MAGGEAFTILAVLDARDRISAVMQRVDATLDRFAGTSDRAAASARIAGQAIDDSFLQTASGAEAMQVATARVSAARAQLSIVTQRQAAAERELIAAQSNAASSATGDAAAMERQAAAARQLTTAEREAATAAGALRDAEARQTLAADAAAGRTSAAAANTTALGASAAGSTSRIGGATKAMVGMGVAAGAIVYESVKAATSFQTLTTRLVTSANESASNLKMVQQGILQISTATGTAANQVAQGMYTVESAGYHGAAGLNVLKAATEGAKIEGADFATVSNAVTDALKDFHRPASDATKVTSQLITAVAYGKTTFQNLSSAMANVLPVAASVHLKMNDVVGVLSEMTSHGVTAQRASQNIARAIQSLVKPSGTMIKEFQALGTSSDEVQHHLGTDGLAGTLQWLSGVAHANAGKLGQNYTEAMAKIMGTSAGLNVALQTTGAYAGETSKAVAGIGSASADADGHVKGFGDVQQTLAFQLDKTKAAIHNTGIAIGTALLPAVTRVATAVARFMVPVGNWISHHQKLTTIILGSLLALGALAAIVTVVGAVIAALSSGVGLVVAGIALLAAGVAYAYNRFAGFREVVNAIGVALKGTFTAAWRGAAAVVTWFSQTVLPLVRTAINALFSWFNAHQKTFVDGWNAMARGVQEVAKWFKTNVIDWIQARIQDLVSWWQGHSQQIEQIWKAMWLVISTDMKVTWDAIKGLLGVMKGTWVTTWGILRDTVKLAWGIISATVTMAMHTLLNVIAVILDVITGHWGKAWKDVKKLTSQGIHDAWNVIKTTFSGAATLLYDAGVNVIKGLINGMKSMLGSVKGAMGTVTSTIRKFLPFSPAKEGPLSGSGSPDISGGKISQMLATGILANKHHVAAAMTQLAGAATGEGLGVGGLLGGFGGSGLALTSPGRMGAGSGTVINIDIHGNEVLGDQAMQQLADKIGRQVATKILPQGGVRIRM